MVVLGGLSVSGQDAVISIETMADVNSEAEYIDFEFDGYAIRFEGGNTWVRPEPRFVCDPPGDLEWHCL